MKKLMIFAACLMLTGSANAYECFGGDLGLDFESGWRQDHVDFEAAGVDGSPSKASQTVWRDLRCWANYGRVAFDYCNVVVGAYGDYGRLYNGHSRSKTWSTTALTADNKAESDRGEVFDYGVVLGYRFPWCYCDQHFVITPLVGWERNEQHLRQFKGENVLNVQPVPFTDMHNNYQTRWSGPWLGYDVVYCLPCNLSFNQFFDWHWASYRAHGKVNQTLSGTTTENKYTHKDNGQGYRVGAGLEYRITCKWFIGITTHYTNMWCHNGKEKTTLVLPTPGSQSVKLRDVNWRSWVLRGQIGYDF